MGRQGAGLPGTLSEGPRAGSPLPGTQGETELVTSMGAPGRLQLISQQELCGPEGLAGRVRWEEAETHRQDAAAQQAAL